VPGGQGIADATRAGKATSGPSQCSVSSNWSSNANTRPRTSTDQSDHATPAQPKNRTDSDGFGGRGARLLIRGFLILPVSGEVDQPGRSGSEAAGIEVQPCQALGEVDVKPLATRRLRVPGSKADKRGRDTTPLMLTGDLGIEEEGVIAAVPCHVDKTDQAAAGPQARGGPAKTMRPDLVPPPGHGLAAMCPDECHHFCISDRPAPAVLNRFGHRRDRSASRRNRQHGGASGHPVLVDQDHARYVPDRTRNRG